MVIAIVYLLNNKDSIIREHLTEKEPTLFSLEKDIEDTNEKVDTLRKEFDQMRNQASAQASQAAAARAQIEAAKYS